MRLSVIGKKIILNQIFLSKLWYIGQTYTVPKYIKKKIENMYDFQWNGKKAQPLRHLAQLFICRGFIVSHRHSIKLSKNKIDSKVIKSHQCILERFHAVLTELNSEF